MRIPVGMLGVQSHSPEHFDDDIITLLLIRCHLVDIDGLADDISHRHTRIQAGIGILEYDLHPLPVGKHVHKLLFLHIKDHFIIVNKPSPGGLIQPKQCTPGGSLAAAGFPYQPQGLPLGNGKGHVIYGLNIFFVFPEASCREILL